jgi:hypothetical protein
VNPSASVLDPAVEAAWAALSVAMTDEAPMIADRDDLLVRIEPGAGHGAPACFLPAHARVEVDGAHLEIDPATARPWEGPGDRTRYGTAWGLLTHECAHARHSTWHAPPDTPAVVRAAAELLEEARIEAAQLRRRADDRHWLRASSTRLILTDLLTALTPTPPTSLPATSAAPATSGPGVMSGPGVSATAPTLAEPTPTTPGPTTATPAVPDAPGTASKPTEPLPAGLVAAGTGGAAGGVPVTPPPPAGTTPASGRLGWPRAAYAAGLILARVDAGVLTAQEVAPVAGEIEAVLGTARLARLRALWQAALVVADDDTETMLELGRRWCAEVGTDPAAPARSPHAPTHPGGPGDPSSPGGGAGAPPSETAPATPSGPGETAPGGSGDGPAGPQEPRGGDRAAGSEEGLIEAVRRTCAGVEVAVLIEGPQPGPTPAQATAEQEAAETAARDQARDTAQTLLRRGVLRLEPSGRGTTATAGTREPRTVERSAAQRLGRAMSTAGARERTPHRTSSVLPPGRLRMRGALAADAQRAAGAIPTAEPFVRTTRTTVPAPPLRVGVACDVSGSMGAFAEPVASTAWVLAHAAKAALVPVTTATVIFGRHVRVLTRPGQYPPMVTEFACDDGTERPDVAIEALDGALDLTRPDAARLLVVISDGRFRAGHRRVAQTRLDRLIAAGCAVLWLTPDKFGCDPLSGATVHPLTDPTSTASAIGRAATTALRRHP